MISIRTVSLVYVVGEVRQRGSIRRSIVPRLSLFRLVREDLGYGVRDGENPSTHHVVRSANLAEPYGVGILTANHGYLLRPSFFSSQLYDEFPRAPLDVQHVDDIWINGHAARRNVSRYVVPSCCSPISVLSRHVLAEHLSQHQFSRVTANEHALQLFGQYWDKDIWYRFGRGAKPIYRSWVTTINREWIGLIQWVKFVLYFGFVYD